MKVRSVCYALKLFIVVFLGNFSLGKDTDFCASWCSNIHQYLSDDSTTFQCCGKTTSLTTTCFALL